MVRYGHERVFVARVSRVPILARGRRGPTVVAILPEMPPACMVRAQAADPIPGLWGSGGADGEIPAYVHLGAGDVLAARVLRGGPCAEAAELAQFPAALDGETAPHEGDAPGPPHDIR